MVLHQVRPAAGFRLMAALVAAAGLQIATGMPSRAQDKPGRYMMNPVEGGFARLDTETGAMSICKPQSSAGTWACIATVDEASAQEARARKLEGENRELRAEVKRMEDLLGLNGEKPKDDEKRAERPGGGLNLPSEQDVDKALSYMERMVKKFQDTMKRLERRAPEKSDI